MISTRDSVVGVARMPLKSSCEGRIGGLRFRRLRAKAVWSFQDFRAFVRRQFRRTRFLAPSWEDGFLRSAKKVPSWEASAEAGL